MKQFLGIIGGVGPEATAYFYKKIIKMTKVDKDQDHIDMVILNHATIPSRHDYIMNKSNDNPLPFITEDIKLLEKNGSKFISCSL
jgi:aspartate racemase